MMLSCDMNSWWCHFCHQMLLGIPLAIFVIIMVLLAVKDMGRDKENDDD